jgi:hypothetical protein
MCPRTGMYDSSKYVCPDGKDSCPPADKLDPFNNPCPAGYYCTSGKSTITSDMLCPEGYYCLDHTTSMEDALKNICPAGRWCIQGTPANDIDDSICDKIKYADYTVSLLTKNLTINETSYLVNNDGYNFADFTLIPQLINQYCHIGSVCPKNYYCPEGTGSLNNIYIGPKKCSDGRVSNLYSYDEFKHCYLKVVTRYVDLDIYGIDINLGDDSILYSQHIYKFRINTGILDKINSKIPVLGDGYDIIFEFNLGDDVKNKYLYNKFANATTIERTNLLFPPDNMENGCFVYLVENIAKSPSYFKNVAPLQKLPLAKDLFLGQPFVENLEFFIITNFQIQMKIKFVAVDAVLKSSSTKINGIELTQILNDNNLDGKPFIENISDPNDFGSPNSRYILKVQAGSDIVSPLNLNNLLRYSFDESKRDFYVNKLAALSIPNIDFIMSNSTLKDFDGIMEPDDLFSLINNYMEQTNFYTQFIPYISNCNGLGAYIPIWKLLVYEDKNSTNSCNLIAKEDTTPINIYVPHDATSDTCDLKFRCNYDGSLQQQSILSNKPWIYAANSKYPLFYISTTVLKDEDYLNYMGVGKGNENVHFIPVNAFNEKENITFDYVPQNVNMTLYYYQADINQKIMTYSEVRFSKFVSYNNDYNKIANKGYNFYFKLKPWTWVECMNNFLFPMYWYVLILVIFILLYLSFIFIINVIARATSPSISGYVPRFTPSVSVGQGLSSMIGWFLGMVPFIFPVLILKLTFNEINFGTLLFDKLTDQHVNIGRIGGSLLVFAIGGLIFTAKLMTPEISYFDKNRKFILKIVKLYSDEQLKEVRNKSQSQFSTYLIFVLLFAVMLAGEYVTVNYILMDINNIFDNLNSLFVTVIQIAGIQFINHIINGFFVTMCQDMLIEQLYILPFRILAIVN